MQHTTSCSPRPSVIVADDHAQVRSLIRLVLGDFADVHECADAAEAVRLHDRVQPDAVLLDVHMPGGGLVAARQIASSDSGCVVVIVTGFADSDTRAAAMRAGARAFVRKDDLSLLPDLLRRLLAPTTPHPSKETL